MCYMQDEPSIGKSPAVGAETSSQDYHLTVGIFLRHIIK